MKIEVFKDFSGGYRVFDSKYPDYITWAFNSVNKRDQPPEYINTEAPGPQADDTIYFDTEPSKLILSSELSNVVLDYQAPEAVLQYLTGTFTAFKTGSTDKWHVEVVFKDDSGIDSGAYRVYVQGSTDNLLLSSRKSSIGPEYSPTVIDNSNHAISLRFEKSPVLKNMYRMIIDVDPSQLPSGVIKQCNEEISYLNLAVDIYDIAGNILQFNFPDTFILFGRDQKSIVEDLSKLRISFIDTYPLNMLIGTDEIGNTTVSVDNKNISLAKLGLGVKIGIASDSVGYLVPNSKEAEFYDADIDQTSLTTIQRVDGIDSTGYVHVFAYIDATDDPVSCNLTGEEIKMTLDKNFGQLVKNATYAEGFLGKFITECEDNNRKIYVDPFVPGIIKNEEIFGLCKMFERYLNTIYTKMSGDCRIGILEKTHRISDFKDIDVVEPELIGYYAREHGSEFTFTDRDIRDASDVLKKYSALDFNNDDISERVYRRIYGILPYIDRYKGTMRAFDLVFHVLGINAKMYPLWQDPYDPTRMLKEEYAGKNWKLTGHIALELSEDYSKEDVQKLAAFTLKAAKDILPVTRVISNLISVDKTENHYDEETGEDKKDINLITHDDTPDPINNNDEMIAFTWNVSSLTAGSNEKYVLDIPSYADQVTMEGDGYLPDCAAFFLNRWFQTKKTMNSCKLYLKFETSTMNTIVTLTADRIYIHRNRVRLTLPKTNESFNAINSFNDLRLNQTSNLTIKFKFNRAMKNFCISLDS